MVNGKKSKKAKQPLAIRVLKIIVIALACAILLAAIANRIKHYYWHLTK